MTVASSPRITDPARLAALGRASLLDTRADEAFDRLARLARRILRVPVALVSIVDADRQVFMGCVGLPEPWATARETPLSHSFCQYAVESGKPLIIADARTHPLVRGNRAIEDLGVIAYAGIPLITREGLALGSFCVIDGVPREWTTDEIELLTELSAAVMTEIELRAEVAERSVTEAALRSSETRYRFLTESLPVQVWTARPDGHLDFVTDRCARYFGRSASDVVGEGWMDVVHPDDLPTAVERWTRSLRTGEPYQTEFRLLRAHDASYRWHLSRADALRDETGAIIRWIGSNTDIDERMRAEAGLEHAYEQMQSAYVMLGERTREAEEARANATRANDAKTKFLNMVSHELRTPLGAIGGYTDLLQMGLRGPVTTDQNDYLTRIKQNQQHLLRMINDLLGFAKVESGQVNYDVTDVPICDIVTAVETMIQPQLGAKRIRYSRDVDTSAVVRADVDKARQVVLNLLSNAVKFTPAEGMIAVAARRVDDAVTVTVRDSGFGIPADKLDAVFQPFVQVETPQTKNIQGTGLGLAISREFARGMGGDVTVRSEPGVGSEFTVRLPTGTTREKAPSMRDEPAAGVMSDERASTVRNE